MTQVEVKKIMSYLLSAYPKTDLGDSRKTGAVLKVWEDVLESFPYGVGQKTCKDWVMGGNKFFPNIAELVPILDRVWDKEEQKRKEEYGNQWHDAAKMLFHDEPAKIKTKYGDIVKLSVSLIRDVCNGDVKYQSPEWNIRQSEIERLV